MALIAGLTETVGGSLIPTGLLTPFGATAVIGTMTAAGVVVHLPNGLWNTKGGIELPLVNAAVAAALAFAGPADIRSIACWDGISAAWDGGSQR